MKRKLALLLCMVQLLTLLAGCGTAAQEETTVPETEAAAETAAVPETQPSESPEERLVASLPEKVRKAYEQGIVGLDMLADLERICTGSEAAAMLQNARILKRGTESVILNQVAGSVHSDIEVTRYWMAQMMHAAEIEFFVGSGSEEYLENLQYLIWDAYSDLPDKAGAYFHQPRWLVSENYGVVSHTSMQKDRFDKWADQDAVIPHGYMTGITDFLEGSWEIKEKPEEWLKYVDYGSPESMGFALMFCDRTTGEKLMPWTEDFAFLPREKMTVEAAVEAALRYYNYFPAEPEMLAYADIPAYDRTIITDDLLTRETTLPEASCQNLPKEWKGVEVRDLLYSDGVDAKVDANLYESEIQLIKDAGFNYVQILFDFQYLMSEIPDLFYIFSDKPGEGMMNETHLKELDRIIAWCMERDIHVNLCCTDVVGWPEQMIPDAIFAKPKYAEPLAEQWQVLARRYAQIPNTYLSFTMFHEPAIWTENYYEKFFPTVVEAIRTESPERCIIAQVNGKFTGECMAELGVALASSAIWPEELMIEPKDPRTKVDQLMAEISWPYEKNGKVYDGESAMMNHLWGLASPDEVAATAKEYGVGYMVYSWAPYIKYGNSVRRERFTDEMLQSYLTDLSETLAQRGYGWCYGNWFSFVGFGAAYPAIRSTTYTRLNDAPLYVDNETFAWLQEINGAAE